MPDVPDTVTDSVLRARLIELQRRLRQGMPGIDTHQRLVGRPVSYNIIAGQTLEIVFKEVPSIDESEVLGVKRLIGETCFCSVKPHTAETLTVRFVVPLKGAARGGRGTAPPFYSPVG